MKLQIKRQFGLSNEKTEGPEGWLVVVQDQMGYLIRENISKDMIAYSDIKEKLDEEYDRLKNTLSDMTAKAKKIVEKEAKIDKVPNMNLFPSLSRISKNEGKVSSEPRD